MPLRELEYNIQSSSPRRTIQRKRTTTHLTGQSRTHQSHRHHWQSSVTAATAPNLFDPEDLIVLLGSRMCTSRGSDVKSCFRLKLFGKENLTFERNRMLKGSVNTSVVTTTSVDLSWTRSSLVLYTGSTHSLSHWCLPSGLLCWCTPS